MVWKELDLAGRYLKRQFGKAIGKSIPKIVTELVTNSDDSYRKLETQGKSAPVQRDIVIEVNRSKSKIAVIDQAQGLTQEQMQERFYSYGQDSSPDGTKTRSLFGKGLRDVLFTQQMGMVKSIKDGKSAIAEFRWKGKDGEDRPCINVKAGPPVNADLRESWGIRGNGTRVEFQMSEDLQMPQHDVLAQKLANFYMLRLLNSNPLRRIVVRSIYPKQPEESVLRYQPPVGEQLIDEKFDIPFENFPPIKATLRVSRSPEDLVQGEHGHEGREGGILVFDENDNVLDITMFGYDRDPAISHLFGTLQLDGAGAIIRAKLNATKPEELLTETRDGFTRSHDLFRAISKKVDHFLKPLVEKEKASSSRDNSPLAEKIRKQAQSAFDLLNNLFKEIVKETPGGPSTTKAKPQAMAFAAQQTTTKAGTFRPIALLINPEAIPDGTEVRIESSSPDVEVKTSTFRVAHSTAKDGVITKIITLHGTKAGSAKVTASTETARAELNVFVVDAEVYVPPMGLGFSPDHVTVAPGRRRTLKLFADTTRLGEHYEVILASDNPAIALERQMFDLRSAEKLSPQISVLEITVTGTGIGLQGTITAVCGTFRANATVKVSKHESSPPRQGGPAFRDFGFMPLATKVQTQWDPESGRILINSNDPLNKRYFGEEPYRAIEENVHCQIRLADLMLDEALQFMVSKALETGGVEVRFPDNPEIDIRTHVCEYKFKMGPEMHKAFVKDF